MSGHPKESAVSADIAEAVYVAIEAEDSTWKEVRTGASRRSPMFEFAQSLRASPYFASLEGATALHLIRSALGPGTTLAAYIDHCDDPDASFLTAWRIVVSPGVFEHAVALAKREPVSTEHSVSPKYSLFLRVCAHLQQLSGDAPIIVPVRTFAEAIEVSPMTITTYRRLAQAQGLLELVSEGNKAARKAARFRFLGAL